MNAEEELAERLFDAPYAVIDFLPRQVPADRNERYGEIERYYREPARLEGLYRRFAQMLIRLGCYYDFVLTAGDADGEERAENPSPALLAARIAARSSGGYANLLFPSEEALIALDGGDLWMTLYRPRLRGEFFETVRSLAQAERFHVRLPEEEAEADGAPRK